MVKVCLTLSHLPIARYDKFRQTFLGFFSTTDEHKRTRIVSTQKRKKIMQVSIARANAGRRGHQRESAFISGSILRAFASLR